MNAPFAGRRQRGRGHELPLSEFPAWGLEMMMGLYGPDTIKQACAEEEPPLSAGDVAVAHLRTAPMPPPAGGVDAASDRHRSDQPNARAAYDAEPLSPMAAEFEAMNALARYLEKRLRRH